MPAQWLGCLLTIASCATRLPPAGYKRMAGLRRTIRVTATMQLAYVVLRTLWHSIPALTGGALPAAACLEAASGCMHAGCLAAQACKTCSPAGQPR